MNTQKRHELRVVLRALHRSAMTAARPARSTLGQYAHAPHLRRLEAGAQASRRRLWADVQAIATPTTTGFEATWRALVTRARAFLASTPDAPLAHTEDRDA